MLEKIVFFTHPRFIGSQSMPRYASILANGMKEKRYDVEIWHPRSRIYSLGLNAFMRKWFGYFDQYILFAGEIRRRIKQCPPETLFVFTDQALGPWVPLVADRPHIIHCHDFLAQFSALGKVPENRTNWTGRRYQGYIRSGYTKGRNFISVSEKTKADLHTFLPQLPLVSEVVYNCVNPLFIPIDQKEARASLSDLKCIRLLDGFILHVGGNQWYKNRKGVIEIYSAWRKRSKVNLPLLLIGEKPTQATWQASQQSQFSKDIFFRENIDDKMLQKVYVAASLLLFPSLAEGFGWPIAEAMACGCPVITTDEAPMTEVAGEAGFFISRKPVEQKLHADWAYRSANEMEKVLMLPNEKKEEAIAAGFNNAKRFDNKTIIDQYEAVYQRVVLNFAKAGFNNY